MSEYVTVPNAVTIARTVAAMVLGVAGVRNASLALTVAAFLVYWAGDMLDGHLARLLQQETRVGAVLDIVCDRACCSLCLAALLGQRPDMALPIAIFLMQFMVLDCQLSLSFLSWPILSPNYFWQVHRGVYRWNWSPPAKAVNTGALAVLVLTAPSPLYPLVLALAVLTVKVASLVVVGNLSRSRDAVPALLGT